MEEAPRRNATGQWIVLTEENKKELNDLLENAVKYEATLTSIGDIAEFFAYKMIDKIKPEPVPIDRAKAALKSLASTFDEKRQPLLNALEKIASINSDLTKIISELSSEKFSHRIERFHEIREKLEVHNRRLGALSERIETGKMLKLEEAKTAIMKGHRKDYFGSL